MYVCIMMMHACTHTCMYACMHVCMCAWCIHTCIHDMHTCASMGVCVCTRSQTTIQRACEAAWMHARI